MTSDQTFKLPIKTGDSFGSSRFSVSRDTLEKTVSFVPLTPIPGLHGDCVL